MENCNKCSNSCGNIWLKIYAYENKGMKWEMWHCNGEYRLILI